MSDLETMLTKLLVDKSWDSKQYTVYVKVIISLLSKNDNLRFIILFLNKQLAIPKNRSAALQLLDIIFEYLPLQCIAEYLSVWLKSILAPTNQDYNCLEKILNIDKSIHQEIGKAVVPLIPKIVEACLGYELIMLKCLKQCLVNYPSTCGPLSKKIESHLLSILMQSDKEEIVFEAGAAYNHLQAVGSTGLNYTNYKKNWCNAIYTICATIHEQYNKFFCDVLEYFEVKDLDKQALNYPIVAGTTILDVAWRLKRLIIFFKYLLSESFPTQRCLDFEKVFHTIMRGLHVDIYDDKSLDTNTLCVLLYEHQLDLLHLLGYFFLRFQRHLLPYHNLITKLLLDCLARTEKKYFESLTEYRQTIYRVLEQWILISGNMFSVNAQNKLLKYILDDITLNKEEVTIKENDDQQKSNYPVSFTTKTYANALSLGTTIFNHVKLQSDSSLYKNMCNAVFQSIKYIQNGNLKAPYTDLTSQRKTYNLLVAIANHSVYNTQLSVNLLSNGSYSEDSEISLICKEGLSTCVKIYMPKYLSLNLKNSFHSLNDIQSSEIEKFEKTVETLMVDNETEEIKDDCENDVIKSSSFDDSEIGAQTSIAEVEKTTLDDNGLGTTQSVENKSNIVVLDNVIVKPPFSIRNEIDNTRDIHKRSSDEVHNSETNPNSKKIKLLDLNNVDPVMTNEPKEDVSNKCSPINNDTNMDSFVKANVDSFGDEDSENGNEDVLMQFRDEIEDDDDD